MTAPTEVIEYQAPPGAEVLGWLNIRHGSVVKRWPAVHRDDRGVPVAYFLPHSPGVAHPIGDFATDDADFFQRIGQVPA